MQMLQTMKDCFFHLFVFVILLRKLCSLGQIH